MIIHLTADAYLEQEAVVYAAVEHRSHLKATATHKGLALNDDDLVVKFALLLLISDDDTATRHGTAVASTPLAHAIGLHRRR